MKMEMEGELVLSTIATRFAFCQSRQAIPFSQVRVLLPLLLPINPTHDDAKLTGEESEKGESEPRCCCCSLGLQ